MVSSRRETTTGGPTGRRLTAENRERQIVEGAIAYFAEVGLDGHTRELARRLGIAQPLLFRYFPTKAALIERIYQEVYLRRWDAGWEAVVRDGALPCLERFRRFEIDYQRRIDDYAWLRIFVSAGLKGFDLPSRYLGMVRERIFAPLLEGMRAESNLPSPREQPLAPDEFELLFGIHGALVYVGLRSRVYGIDGTPDRDAVRAAMLDAALPGLLATHRRVVIAGGPKG
ncbi:TetR/AcrR family transcriptional regulator [Methylobacterium nonmethylotrophicum]|uniref:TetR/AcrR family transcriptional regulator n=1 Tax=Methylobacterium nonmethylotrophicum TaxID=1141884 RepID=A0A4Z0NPY1_9HYPH|nr:TetR/AcrR family transcriptional regulator [Methylobacterium nonmethylotrophicum]TGD98993.1 TetR/AcrR family transcriptional regulator [Methylobacterium nonmethylotrophicum]